MKLHIELDPFGRGIICWVFNAADGIGPYLPCGDPFRIEVIDKKAIKRLRELLELATEGNWLDYGLKADELARDISFCLTRISETMPEALNEEPVIRAPDAFARSLELENNRIELKEWLRRYPTQKKA